MRWAVAACSVFVSLSCLCLCVLLSPLVPLSSPVHPQAEVIKALSEILTEFGAALGPSCYLRLNHSRILDFILEVADVDRKKRGKVLSLIGQLSKVRICYLLSTRATYIFWCWCIIECQLSIFVTQPSHLCPLQHKWPQVAPQLLVILPQRSIDVLKAMMSIKGAYSAAALSFCPRFLLFCYCSVFCIGVLVCVCELTPFVR
jgi:hypothetical protein